MRWTPGGPSSDLEDRRGSSGGFGGGGMRIGLGGAAVLLVLSLIFKQNFFALLGGTAAGPRRRSAAGPVATTPEEDKQVEFVSFVLDDAQKTWEQLFRSAASLPAREAGAVPRRDPVGVRSRRRRRWARSTAPATRRSTSTSGFYDELKRAVRRAG